ncbi:hypothetical protein U9M48_030895 [Paspalum notatum var. saurae]|uniref:Uncharacterized protein n=1 Tax=Paspalum notatum var. saurae TaxID=547442 RepID=A0AAQ3U5R4_PASNO
MRPWRWPAFCVGRGLPSPTASAAGSESAFVAEAVTGSHVLHTKGYSQTKGVGNGKFVRSSAFSLCGHRWYIHYYPEGEGSDIADWISLFLQHDHTDDDVDVRARIKFSVLDGTSEPVPKFSQGPGLATFSSIQRTWGFMKFTQRKALEESPYVKDDCLRVRCDITIPMDIRTEPATPPFVIENFGRLFLAQAGMDITFEVAGETIPVLVARSPVFMADLLGSMKDKAMDCIRIDDIEPAVFKATLHYIYTDTLPKLDMMGTRSSSLSICLYLRIDMV